MREPDCDLFVIGGGVNGAAVARDAAGRGLKVYLAEEGDYGGQTSSASSKLIHGGLRYLERYEFAMVRESLKERDILLKSAPHLVRPLRFLLPIYKDHSRPTWMLKFGLHLYDLLAGSKKLSKSGSLNPQSISEQTGLATDGLSQVLHYHDCQVDDARLVLSLLLDARTRGADVGNRRHVVRLAEEGGLIRIDVRDDSGYRCINAKYVVNTAGPWTNQINALCQQKIPEKPLRLVRGSHIVLPMPNPVLEDAFTLQHEDGRVIFVMPWLEGRFLMVGTTDEPQDNMKNGAVPSAEERSYLLAAFNRYFKEKSAVLSEQDIIWSWAGVRPLVDENEQNLSKVTRDVKILRTRLGQGGIVTVYGGKLTSHRRTAEKVMKNLEKLGCSTGRAWTAKSMLIGGGLPYEELQARAIHGPESLSQSIRHRFVNTYGDVAEELFDSVMKTPSKALEVVPGVPEVELQHSAEFEDAKSADDFLTRRTKLFLTMSASHQQRIKAWFGR